MLRRETHCCSCSAGNLARKCLVSTMCLAKMTSRAAEGRPGGKVRARQVCSRADYSSPGHPAPVKTGGMIQGPNFVTQALLAAATTSSRHLQVGVKKRGSPPPAQQGEQQLQAVRVVGRDHGVACVHGGPTRAQPVHEPRLALRACNRIHFHSPPRYTCWPDP